MKTVCPKHHLAYEMDQGCPDCVPPSPEEVKDALTLYSEMLCEAIDVRRQLSYWGFIPDYDEGEGEET